MANNDKKTTEEEIPMIDTANKKVLEFSKKEDAEGDRIFYEAQGLQPDGTTPLEEDPEDKKEKPVEEKKEKPVEEKKEEDNVRKEEDKKEKPVEDGVTKDNTGMPEKEEILIKTTDPEDKKEKPVEDGVTVENASKRISAAQNMMHKSNKTANEAVKEQTRLQSENDDLRKIIDENATKSPEDPEDKKEEDKPQSEEEVNKELEALKTEYPEIALPMIKMIQRQTLENKALKVRLDKQDDREVKREAVEKATQDTAHYNAIEKVHKDFIEIGKEPLLDEWISNLPSIEKAGATAIRKTGTTEEVISLLTTFKKANGYKMSDEETKTPSPRKSDSKLEKAKKHSTPQFNRARDVNIQDRQFKFTQEEIKGWTDKQWKDNEKAVDEAMSEGLVR